MPVDKRMDLIWKCTENPPNAVNPATARILVIPGISPQAIVPLVTSKQPTNSPFAKAGSITVPKIETSPCMIPVSLSSPIKAENTSTNPQIDPMDRIEDKTELTKVEAICWRFGWIGV